MYYMTACVLSEDSLRLLTLPENAKSKQIYKRHQNEFLIYMRQEKYRGYGENNILNYFSKV